MPAEHRASAPPPAGPGPTRSLPGGPADRRARTSADERRRAVVRAIVAQERERGAVAALLHDEPVQILTALGLRLGIPEGVSREELQERIDAAIGHLRRTMRVLDPGSLAGVGLGAALRRELQDAARDRPGLRTRLDDRGLRAEPSEATALVLVRVLHAATGASLAAEPTELDVAIDGVRDEVTCALRVVCPDPAALLDRLSERLEDWLATVGELDGSWSLVRGDGSLRLVLTLPADL
ncbi:MAG: hypothetical protein KatS3mg013_1253 [Actinomycetota bacterium]|jgi:hypothetical protein|nr:MAG: hypothetical protein KatS3mg013_1253 [Actinomycetota bacterium]